MPELERLELVGETNFAGLIAMAECYSRMMQATRIIRTQGVMGHDPDKGKHPAIAVVEESSRNLDRCDRDLGGTIKDRLRTRPG